MRRWRRDARRKERVGQFPFCLSCGYACLECLTTVTRRWLKEKGIPDDYLYRLLQEHHIEREAINPDLVVTLCLNCHKEIEEGLANEGVSFYPEKNLHKLIALVLRASAVLFDSLANSYPPLGEFAGKTIGGVMNYDIYVRAHTIQIDNKEYAKKSEHKKEIWPELALVFDCETRLSADQSLTFGFWRACEFYREEFVPVEEGIFHDGITSQEVDRLKKYTKNNKSETVQDNNDCLHLYCRSKFIDEVLGMAIQSKALVVGFNLPFDLSRIAVDWTPSDDGGWSLICKQFSDQKTGEIKPDKFFPRIIIKALNSKTAIIRSTRAPLFQPKEKGKKAPLWPAARFLDLRTLPWALRNKSYSLRTACKEFNIPGKLDHKPSGAVTFEEIEYCRQDVRATVGLLNALKRECDLHPIDLGPDKMFSPASIAKAYLEKLDISYPNQKVTNG